MVLLLAATQPEVDDEAIAVFRDELPTADVRAVSDASHDLLGDAEAEVPRSSGPG
jgi:hypothetical protein